MIWTVVWMPMPDAELADLWTTAPDRRAVATAANEIDRRLRINAEREGTDFYGDRMLVVPPLAVVFSISPDDCLVTVLQVERIDP